MKYGIWCNNGQCGFICATFDDLKIATEYCKSWNNDNDGCIYDIEIIA